MSKKQEHAEQLERLREWIKPGDTVYTVLRHVSRSGMQREIGIVLMRDVSEGGPLHPNYAVGTVLDYRVGKSDGIIVGGAGMDMGFHVVYSLGRVLFPDGFGCIGKECRSNDHSNGDRDYTPHPGCGTPDARGHRDHWHTDGGYALRHQWL